MIELGTDTITIVRPAAADWRGDPTGPPCPDRTVSGCSVQPASSSESNDRRTTVVATWRLFAPGGTDLRATDRVRWQGAEYEVVGEPDRWRVDGEQHHLQADLRRVRG